MNNKIEKNPLISVVIPCYNHENFVQEAIQSVIDQDYLNIELIIIDDGSRDASIEKIKKMTPACEKRFSRFEFRHRVNKGLCATINEAVEWIEGSFLAIIASDDVMLTTRISNQCVYLEKNPDVAAVFGGVLLINEKSETVGKKTVKNKKYHFDEILLFKAALYAPTMLIRSGAIKLASPLPTDIFIEDRLIQLCITKVGWKIASENSINTKYRIHQNNSSKRILKCYADNIKLINLFSDKKERMNALSLNEIGCATSLRNVNKSLSLKHLGRALSIYPPCFFSFRFIKTSLLIAIGL